MASRRCVARRHRPCARLAHSVPGAATPTVTAENQAHPPSGPVIRGRFAACGSALHRGCANSTARCCSRGATTARIDRIRSPTFSVARTCRSLCTRPRGRAARTRECRTHSATVHQPLPSSMPAVRGPGTPHSDTAPANVDEAAPSTLHANSPLTGGRWRARGAWAPSSVRCAALALGACCRETDRYGRGPRTGPSAPLHDRFAPCGSPLRAGVIQVAISCVARTLTVRLHGHPGQGPGQHTARAAHAIPPTNAPLPGSPAVR